ncbi:MAG: CocE/NonD family hydrolase [Acidobacteriaceae bacterium]
MLRKKQFSLVPFILSLLILFCLCSGSAAWAQKEASPHVQSGSAALDALVGQYSDPDEPEIVLSIYRDGDHLYLNGERIPPVELLADSPDHFSSSISGTKFIFEHGADGKVTGLRRVAGGKESTAKRVSDSPVRYHFRPYSRKEVMIPMRDGVKLHAIILRPTDTDKALPFLMQRTPYGVDESTPDYINSRYAELARSGYIFVMEDIRGRYESQGKFVMNRPVVHVFGNRTDPKLVDESSDTYDTVAWLLKSIPNNNGRVGVMGISYPGFLAIMAGIDPHPAVKAISPQAPMTDIWLGDDFFHNGAFRETYGYDYVLGMESSKKNTFGKLDEDAYDYFLKAGSFLNAAKKAGLDELPTGKAFLEHPAYDSFWQSMAVQPHLTQVTVPTLEVGGWWDQEDMWGTQAEYAALEPHDSQHEVFMVLGPWNHGEWARTTRHLGVLDFGSATTDYFRKQFEAPFFAHYLKDEKGFDLKDTAAFQTGSDRWMRYNVWPPKKGFEMKSLYLEAGGKLGFAQPEGADKKSFTAYVSDPKHPVPYRHRPIQATYAPGSHWYTWLVEDQRFVTGRKDVATWSTPVLDHDVTVTGDVVADIFAATSGSDNDWVVKLIDEYPNDASQGKMAGYQLMIVDEIFRGRYRKSFEHPVAIQPKAIKEYKWSLHGADHVFLKGHRILVQVQSSWFPLYDRNPQTFVPNIMTASPDSYKKATEKIYWSAQHPSHIELPVADTQ